MKGVLLRAYRYMQQPRSLSFLPSFQSFQRAAPTGYRRRLPVVLESNGLRPIKMDIGEAETEKRRNYFFQRVQREETLLWIALDHLDDGGKELLKIADGNIS